MKYQEKKGFTLIELLVVIAIIGLISTLVTVGLNTARTKGRDTKRIADLASMRTALELYFDDNGFYPPSSPCGYDCNGYDRSTAATWDSLSVHLKPYLDPLPIDPLNTGNCPPWELDEVCYAYYYGNVFKNDHEPQYDLVARLETPNHPKSCGAMPAGYTYYWNSYQWCQKHGGNYSDMIFEASTE